jgi:hypothetical protein
MGLVTSRSNGGSTRALADRLSGDRPGEAALEVFRRNPGAEAAFAATYGEPPMWNERVKVAELLERVDTVPNAITHGFTDDAVSARAHLAVVPES